MRKFLYIFTVFLIPGMIAESRAQCDTSTTKITPDFTTSGLLCTSDSVQFINQSSVTGGTITGYKWDFDDGETSTEENPNHLFFISSGSNFNVKLVVETLLGCKDSVTKTVYLYNSPIAGFSYEEVCKGDTTPFTNESLLAGGNLTYKWYFGDGTTSTEEDPKHLYKGKLSYKVKLVATSDKGCKDSVFGETVYIGAIPISNFTAKVQGGYVEFTPGSTGYSEYYWDFDDGDTSMMREPTHIYSSTGTYDVSLRTVTHIGCESSTTNPVEINNTSIEEHNPLNLKVYPAAFSNELNITFELNTPSQTQLTLTGLDGKTVYRRTTINGNQGMNRVTMNGLSHLKEGTYILSIQHGHDIYVRKVIRINR